MSNREKLFISWVGLRGAVPIVFATYPLLAGVSKANIIFNLVFFISITSVLFQGTTLGVVASWLRLVVPEQRKRKFAIDLELSEEDKNVMEEVVIENTSPVSGRKIIDLRLQKGVLIVLINRDGRYITPRGSTTILAGDRLMLIADDRIALEKAKDALS